MEGTSMATPSIPDLDKPIWGAKGFAPIIEKTESQTHYLLRRHLLDADKVGRQWVSTARRLLNFSGSATSASPSP
jgi:hypothetical protein